MYKQALVTGGSGFLGTYIAKDLIGSGWNVRIMDLLLPNVDSDNFIQADIRDLNMCVRACEGVDTVFHNVAQVPLAKDKALFESVNIQGTRNILEASAIQNVKNFVFTSSSAVFGLPKKMPVNGESYPEPIEEYGVTKLKGEHLVQAFQDRISNTSIVRPRTILGPGRLGLFSLLFDWISDGLDVFVFDGGEHPYQFIHADDLSKGIVSSSKVSGHNIFNLGALSFSTLRQDLESLCTYANTGSRVRSIPSVLIRKPALLAAKIGIVPFANYQLLLYSQAMYFDCQTDWNILGVSPEFSNSQSLIESYEWFLKSKDSLKLQDGKSIHSSITKGKSVNLIKSLLKMI